jgi:heme-degrading monooxygenase HmoA
MWAQLIKSRAKPGKEEEVRNLPREFEAQGGTPPFVQIFTCTNQNDPSEHYTFVVFESEAAARQNERSPEQAQRVERFREVYEGEPEFVDLNVDYHHFR